MEFKFQTLKNLVERLLKGKYKISTGALEVLDRELVEHAEKVIIMATEIADMTDKRRISEAHIERAIAILQKRR